MGFDFNSLEPLVLRILSAPGTDLGTISAKRVRRELLALEPSLTPDFVKENKLDVDAVITRVFGLVSAARNYGEGSHDPEPVTVSRTSKSPETEGAEEGEQTEEEEEEEEKKVSRKNPKKASKKEGMSDAELARQLSSEINGRSRRASGKGRAGAGTPKRAKSKKSATTVDSDDESGEEGGKKTRKKRAGGGAAKGGFAKEYALSAPLASLLQVDKLSRPQVVKQLWVYIKENERQNPSNKREILCDNNLRAIFNVDKIDMFKMNKVLGQHLHENEE